MLLKQRLSNILISALFCLLNINLFGQLNDIEFDHYTTNDGLSNGYVTSLIQDYKGFIWIGTASGLNRFDGKSFKVYVFDPKDENSISGNEINALIEDSMGNLWIATNNFLNLYDSKKDRFSKKILKSISNSYRNLGITNISYIVSCFIDSRGNMWVGDRGVIFRFKLYNNPNIYRDTIDVESFVLNEPDLGRFNKTTVLSFLEDEKGTIWTASNSNKIFYFNNANNSFIPYTVNHPDADKFSDKTKYMIKDRDGDFIITIEWNGLLIWYRKENKFVLYKPNATDTGPNDDVLFSPAEDKNGLIWVASRNQGGVNIFNKKTGKFKYLTYDKNNPNSISSNSINLIYQDKTGTIWIGAARNAGLNKYSPDKYKFNRYYYNPDNLEGLSYNNVLCFAESKSGDIWIGTDGGGLNKFNRKTGKFTYYTNKKSDPFSVSSNAIVSLCEDHEGTLWLGTFDGGLGMMKRNKFYAYYPDKNNPYSISYMHTWYVFEDSKNNLWVATLLAGLDLFDRKTNRFYNYAFKSYDSTSIISNGLLSIFEDSKHNLYITSYNGVSVINLDAIDFSKMPPDIKFQNLRYIDNKNSLSSNGVYCVTEDKEGNIWFGMIATGIDKLNRKTGIFENYSSNDALPGNSVNSILVDDNNNLWVTTDKGLAEFNPKTKKSKVFDRQDGLLNMDFNGWALKTKDGEMFVCGPEGFNSFYPGRIKYNKNKPPVHITGLKLFNKPVAIGEKINNRVILPENINEIKELVLTYRDNFFTLQFVSLDYTIPEKNKFVYMLKGFDKNWIQSGNKQEAIYTNLDPGRYVFHVKASNNDGCWNETGASLTAIVLPAWWQTLWFKVIIIITISILLYIAYVLRITLLKKKNEELNLLVRQSTNELEKTNDMLKERENLLIEQTIEYQLNEVELKKTNMLLSEKQAQIEEQTEELITVNDQLIEKQKQIEKQNEDLRIYSDGLRDTNELLIEKQRVILNQSEVITKTNQQLSSLNITKDKFFSIIAHDLRNPFNTIIGFSEILIGKYNNLSLEKRNKMLGMIYASSKNGNILLENLLQWSRAQTGKIPFEPANINLSFNAEEVIGLLEGSASNKKITIKQLIDNKIIVFADENMIKTVLRNLISNAIKFTGENGIITLKSVTTDKYVEVTIEDTGVGISKENIEKLFRIDNTISTRGTSNEAGTGLGLLLCKEFVEKHNGKIWVESETGRGSKFKFTLPLL